MCFLFLLEVAFQSTPLIPESLNQGVGNDALAGTEGKELQILSGPWRDWLATRLNKSPADKAPPRMSSQSNNYQTQEKIVPWEGESSNIPNSRNSS